MLNDDFSRQFRSRSHPVSVTTMVSEKPIPRLPIFQAERRHMEGHAGLEHTLFVLLQRDDSPSPQSGA